MVLAGVLSSVFKEGGVVMGYEPGVEGMLGSSGRIVEYWDQGVKSESACRR